MFHKPLFTLVAVLAVLFVIVGTFSFGVSIGQRKAQRLSAWCGSYERNWNPSFPGRPRLMDPFEPSLPGGHGVFGNIVSFSGNQLIVQGKEGMEQPVIISTSTMLRFGRGPGSVDLLRPRTNVAVFGEPDSEGRLMARLIRIFDAAISH